MATQMDLRQSVLRSALSMVGSAANDTADTLFPKIDAELAKLFEDRNILLADGGEISVPSAGTSVTFTQALKLHINSQVAGGAPTVIDLASTTRAFTASGNMLYATINRSLGTATVTADSTTLPAQTSANQEIILIAKRVDSLDGTKTIYFRNGFALQAGQTARLNGDPNGSTANDAATGSNQTLSTVVTGIIRLTSGTLTSVAGIPAGYSGQKVIVENKTGNSININNEDTGATAANRIQTGSGSNVLMSNNASFMFVYDTTSSRWQLVGGTGSGSGSGGSGKNYLSAVVTSQSATPNTGNGDFETGSTLGWSLGTTGTLTNGIPTGTPTFGSGSSVNLALSVVSTGQLAGTYSASYASSTATVAGDMMASDAFYIDTSDQGKMLTWKVYYKAQTNPSNADWSGTSSNSFGVAIYDVTNSAWIETSAHFGMTQSSGVGIATGEFQTPTTTTQLRIVIYNANATSGAVTVYFDDISVGPQTVSFGAAMSDLVANPNVTFVGQTNDTTFTNQTSTIKTARRGDMLYVYGFIAFSGAPGGGTGNFTVKLPYTIDTSKIPNTTQYNQIQGWAQTIDGSVSTSYMLIPTYVDSTHIGFRQHNSASAASATSPFTYASSDSIAFGFWVPISGWSSNVQMSNDTDTRVVGLSISGASPSGSPAATFTNISFGAATKDSHVTWNGTDIYTIPVSGWYSIYSHAELDGTAAAGKTSSMQIYKNSSTTISTSTTGSSSASSTARHQISVKSLVYLNAGDTISIQLLTDFASPTWVPGTAVLDIHRLSGPSVIAASESVNASYSTAAGGTLTTTLTILNFDTKNYDNHNAVTTGTNWKFTAPISGKYRVSAQYSSTGTGVIIHYLQLWKNGSVYRGTSKTRQSTNAAPEAPNLTTTIDLLAGDYIDFRVKVNSGTAGIDADAGLCFVDIERTGN